MTTNFGDAVAGELCLEDEGAHHQLLVEMSDAELKVAIGRLVDEAADGHEIRKKLGKIPSSGRLWQALVHHVCLERIQPPAAERRRRASWKVADFLRSIDQQHVHSAFMQTLSFCCDHFDDKFDALFQRVAAVVDFGRALDEETKKTVDITASESFFKIMKVQDTTSDGDAHRLAFRFAQFLAHLNAPNGHSFEVPDPIQGDVVARLFEEKAAEQKEEMAVDSNGNDEGFALSDRELQDAIKRKAPKTVAEFVDAVRSAEDPTVLLAALHSFPDFAARNQSAVRAQSDQLIRAFMNAENRFHLKDFGPKVISCLVSVLACDLSAVADFCERLRLASGPPERVRLIAVLQRLLEHLVQKGNEPQAADGQKTANGARKRSHQDKEIGKVIRKSVVLNGGLPFEPKGRAAPNLIDPLLRPFLRTVLSLESSKIQDPLTVSAILDFMQEAQRFHLAGFQRILSEYFALLSSVRDTPDWNTQLKCAESYALLGQMAANATIDRSEWAAFFDGADCWLERLVHHSIGQSNHHQHLQLSDFHRGICAFLGK
ncbi:hypothetical protein M3Y99_00472200 [Aphelenchoides fujianensis]|nr:hypothetical protein M3Y99_00472200 [Aphelenchoides fujianensis]